LLKQVFICFFKKVDFIFGYRQIKSRVIMFEEAEEIFRRFDGPIHSQVFKMKSLVKLPLFKVLTLFKFLIFFSNLKLFEKFQVREKD
jgi:hypothetical protein